MADINKLSSLAQQRAPNYQELLEARDAAFAQLTFNSQ